MLDDQDASKAMAAGTGTQERGDEKVPIFVNKDKYFVNRGPETVAYLKELDHVPPADELEELIQGKLEPLPDSGTIDIKGGEKFFSHPRTGSSS